MTTEDALKIVLELARGNISDDPELELLASEYGDACDMIEKVVRDAINRRDR